MITMEKGSLRTQILEVFKDKYIQAGWKEIAPEKETIKDEATKIIAETLSSKKAADSRKRNMSTNKIREAEAIVATELRPKEGKEFTDNLIKE